MSARQVGQQQGQHDEIRAAQQTISSEWSDAAVQYGVQDGREDKAKRIQAKQQAEVQRRQILGSIGCALSTTVLQLQWLRFLQGLGGSIGLVIAFAIVKDAFTVEGMGKMVSMILAVLGLSPVIAPLLGNLLQDLGSWRSIFWALTGYGVFVAVLVALLLPETRSETERKKVVLSRTVQTYGAILVNTTFIPFALALCIAQAGFFAYLAGSASVFISEYLLPDGYSHQSPIADRHA